jgi:hypothetical protein
VLLAVQDGDAVLTRRDSNVGLPVTVEVADGGLVRAVVADLRRVQRLRGEGLVRPLQQDARVR